MSCSRIAELRINSLIQHSIPCQVLIQLKWFKRKRRVNDLTLPDSGFRKWETINSDIHCRPFSLHVPPIPINNQISLNSIINAIIARKKSFIKKKILPAAGRNGRKSDWLPCQLNLPQLRKVPELNLIEFISFRARNGHHFRPEALQRRRPTETFHFRIFRSS